MLGLELEGVLDIDQLPKDVSPAAAFIGAIRLAADGECKDFRRAIPRYVEPRPHVPELAPEAARDPRGVAWHFGLDKQFASRRLPSRVREESVAPIGRLASIHYTGNCIT